MTLLKTSMYAGLIILAIIILRTIALNKLPKAGFLAMWGVALLRLLLPFSFPSKWSLSAILARSLGRFGGGAQGLNNEVKLIFDGLSMQKAPATWWQKIEELCPNAATIWLVIAAILFVLFSLGLIKSCSAVRFASPVGRNELIDEWRASHKLLRPLRVLQSDRITTPAAVGIIRPRIILPKAMSLSDRRAVGYVLTHEYCHIRRLDMLWKMLMLCAVCIHWFNPFAWAMLILLNRDLELSCDEMVLRRCGEDKNERKAYAYSLIEMVETRGSSPLIFSHFSRNAAEERVTAIMKHKKASGLTIAVAVVMVLCLTMAFSASGSHDAPAVKVYIPTQDEILKNGYPVNKNGETFGPNVRELPFSPDLELAENDEGVVGYVRQDETPGASVSSPEEAAAYMAAGPHEQFINMYTEDGQTVIGKFFVGSNH
ncbi:MAG: M56 family metallopeptidase [Clostridia bacterium]|nr:M56 family metallopeptidase [Clostridia bacterium]